MSGDHSYDLYSSATGHFDSKSEGLMPLNDHKSYRYFFDITDRQQSRPSKPSYLKSSNDLSFNDFSYRLRSRHVPLEATNMRPPWLGSQNLPLSDNLQMPFHRELYFNGSLNKQSINKPTVVSEHMGCSRTDSTLFLDKRLEFIERKLGILYDDDMRTKFRKLETAVTDSVEKLEAQIKEVQIQCRELKSNHDRGRWQVRLVSVEEKATEDKKVFREISEWIERLEEKEKLLASEQRTKEKLTGEIRKQEEEKHQALEKIKDQEMQINQLRDDLQKGETKARQIESLQRNVCDSEDSLHKAQRKKKSLQSQIKILSANNTVLRNELKKSAARILEQATVIDKNNKEIELLKAKLQDETEKVLTSTSSNEKLESKASEVTELRNKISSIETRYEKELEKISRLKSKLSKAKANLNEKNKSYDLLVTISEGKEQTVKKDFEDRISYMETKYEGSIAKIETLERQLLAAEATLDEKNNLLTKISKKNGEVATKDSDEAVAESKKVKLELSAAQVELGTKVNELRETNKKYLLMEDKYESIVEELKRMRNELSSAEANAQEAYNSYELLQRRSKKMEMAVNEEYDMTVNELNEVKKELSTVQSQLVVTTKQLENIKSGNLLVEEESEAKNDEIISLKSKNSCLEKELATSEGQVKTLSQSLIEKTSSLENATVLSEKAEKEQKHLQENIAEQQDTILNYESRVRLLQDEIKKLKALNEVLEASLSHNEDNANLLKTEEINLKMDIDKLMNDKKALNERCNQLEELLRKKDAEDNSNHNSDACAPSDINNDGMCGYESDFEEIVEDIVEEEQRDNEEELHPLSFLRTFSNPSRLERIDEKDENISHEAINHLSLRDELAAAMQLEYSDENEIETGVTTDEEVSQVNINNYIYAETVRSGDGNVVTTDEEVSQIDTKDYFYSENVILKEYGDDVFTVNEEVCTTNILYAEQIEMDCDNQGIPDEEKNQENAQQSIFSDFNDTIPTTPTHPDSESLDFFSDLDDVIDELLNDEF